MFFEIELAKQLYDRSLRIEMEDRVPLERGKKSQYKPWWEGLRDELYLSKLDVANLPRYIRYDENGELQIDYANAGFENLDRLHQLPHLNLAKAISSYIHTSKINTFEEFIEIHNIYHEISLKELNENDRYNLDFQELTQSNIKKYSEACYVGRTILLNYNVSSPREYDEKYLRIRKQEIENEKKLQQRQEYEEAERKALEEKEKLVERLNKEMDGMQNNESTAANLSVVIGILNEIKVVDNNIKFNRSRKKEVASKIKKVKKSTPTAKKKEKRENQKEEVKEQIEENSVSKEETKEETEIKNNNDGAIILNDGNKIELDEISTETVLEIAKDKISEKEEFSSQVAEETKEETNIVEENLQEEEKEETDLEDQEMTKEERIEAIINKNLPSRTIDEQEVETNDNVSNEDIKELESKEQEDLAENFDEAIKKVEETYAMNDELVKEQYENIMARKQKKEDVEEFIQPITEEKHEIAMLKVDEFLAQKDLTNKEHLKETKQDNIEEQTNNPNLEEEQERTL